MAVVARFQDTDTTDNGIQQRMDERHICSVVILMDALRWHGSSSFHRDLCGQGRALSQLLTRSVQNVVPVRQEGSRKRKLTEYYLTISSFWLKFNNEIFQNTIIHYQCSCDETLRGITGSS